MENSEPIQIAKEPKVRGFSVRKAWSGETASGVSGQAFVSALERSKDQSIQSHRELFEEIRHLTIFQQAFTLFRFNVCR